MNSESWFPNILAISSIHNKYEIYLLLISSVVSLFGILIAGHAIRVSLVNQKEMLSLQRMMSRKTDFYTYRRQWNSIAMIEARIAALAVTRHFEADAVPLGNFYEMLEKADGRMRWEDIAAVAHFMADIDVELETNELRLTELKRGFPEFLDWSEKLAPLYAAQEDEERIVAQLINIHLLLSWEPTPPSSSRRLFNWMPAKPLGNLQIQIEPDEQAALRERADRAAATMIATVKHGTPVTIRDVLASLSE